MSGEVEERSLRVQVTCSLKGASQADKVVKKAQLYQYSSILCITMYLSNSLLNAFNVSTSTTTPGKGFQPPPIQVCPSQQFKFKGDLSLQLMPLIQAAF